MGLPEGWEWLNDLSEEWDPPADMQEPTDSVGLNLAIQILSRDIFGNDILELVGRLIAEQARFSMWFATEAKSKAPSEKELALLSLVGHEQTRQVYEAWKRYESAFGVAGGLVGAYDDEKAALRDALVSSISALSTARKKFDA